MNAIACLVSTVGRIPHGMVHMYKSWMSIITNYLNAAILTWSNRKYAETHSDSVKPTVVYIEGSIGVGKTTLLKQLASLYTVVFEPSDQWEASGALAAFYNNEMQPGFFQLMALHTRAARVANVLERVPDAHIIVVERSLESDKHVFAKANMTNRWELLTYNCAYDALSRSIAKSVGTTVTVLLDTDIDRITDRIRDRARKEEASISREYLQRVHEENKLFYNMSTSKCKFVVDASKSSEDVFHTVATILENIAH